MASTLRTRTATWTDLAIGLAPLAAGSAVGLATNARGLHWYRTLAKPSWTPPDRAFGPAWTVLYLLQGVAAVIVVRAGREADGQSRAVSRVRLPLALFAGQLGLNLGWSVVFFGLRRIRPAVLEIGVLWGTIVATTVAFGRVRILAAILLVPYLAWTSFAAALNVAFARLNPDR